MRKREVIRDKKKGAKIDSMDIQAIERYVQAYQCPYCKDGVIYKMLPLHIYQMHGITAYEFRKEYAMNRHHKLTSYETAERMSQSAKRNGAGERMLQHPNWGNLENRYKDGGQREEAIKNKQLIAAQPEVKLRFHKTMAMVDRKAVAASIPPEVRHTRSIHAREMWGLKVPPERQREIMSIARSLRTPESEARRILSAKKTFREKYLDNLGWRQQWREKNRKAIQSKAKIPRKDYITIVELCESGISRGKIALQYGVSRGLIHLIIKSYRLGLETLYRKSL